MNSERFMVQMANRINLSPSKTDLKIIEKRLIEEDSLYNEGFYCNWNIIEKSFESNKLITFESNAKIIGFAVYSKYNIYVDIDILEINRNYRKKGFGKIFLNEIAQEFTNQKIIAIRLFCQPQESEHFWRRMGFIKFPTTGYFESDLIFYRPLIEVTKSNGTLDNFNKLELWDVAPYQLTNNSPRWIWNLELSNNKLEKPIIQPCNLNWNLRWTKNGEIVKEDKVKYFSNTENKIAFCPFLYVKELIE
ncbi:MAG: GNAT family N-acetyltransferase [bacterium]